MPAIATQRALAAATWTNTGGGISTYKVCSLAYDSGDNLLYAGTSGQGVWYYTTPPTVSSITPSSGTVGTTVNITNLAGTNFQTGATVKLSKSGQGDIAATGVTVESAREITCDFNFTGAALGA